MAEHDEQQNSISQERIFHMTGKGKEVLIDRKEIKEEV